jgi:S1-C subfamily serine protease
VEGQKIVVGGDILLAVQGIPMASGADRARVFKGLESLQVGDDLRFTVFRDGKIVELAMKWAGFPTQFLAPVK